MDDDTPIREASGIPNQFIKSHCVNRQRSAPLFAKDVLFALSYSNNFAPTESRVEQSVGWVACVYQFFFHDSLVFLWWD